MKINLYYGGRGILDDPSLYVINKMQEVLNELNVKTEVFKLYEMKNTITTLPASINDADGIILATTVEWYGIGGFMQQFLDACWLYGNKEKIASTYMCPVVMSRTYGEKEASQNLITAWEILGGLPAGGVCGYVEDMVSFELNKSYVDYIEKAAENLYRTISQKMTTLPTSNKVMVQVSNTSGNIPLSPEESEQLSKYAADDSYVQQQKEDILELTNLFKDKLEQSTVDENTVFIDDFVSNFNPHGIINATYKFMIKEKKKNLIIEIVDSELKCYYGDIDSPEVLCRLDSNIMNKIISGATNFQRAFMSGEMQVKGDFKVLRMLDQLFTFSN